MVIAQFRDAMGKWINIPTIGPNASVESTAFQYCKQNGVHTRVAEIVESKEGQVTKELKVFTCVRKR